MTVQTILLHVQTILVHVQTILMHVLTILLHVQTFNKKMSPATILISYKGVINSTLRNIPSKAIKSFKDSFHRPCMIPPALAVVQ